MDKSLNPYASPAAAPAGAYPSVAAEPIYRSPLLLGRWVIGLMAARAVLYLMTVPVAIWELRKLGQLDPEALIDFDTLTESDWTAIAIYLPLLLVIMAGAVVFLMWLYRVYANLSAINTAPLQSTPGWAVGVYFIPIVNLFRPYQIMAEVWRLSDPRASLAMPRANLLLGFWWTAALVTWFVSRVALRLEMQAETLGDQVTVAWMSIGEAVGAVVVAILTIGVVRAVDRMQTERLAALPRVESAGWMG